MRVIRKENIGDVDSPFVTERLYLSENAKNRLRIELRRYEKKAVDDFIQVLELVCFAMFIIQKGIKDSDLRNSINKMLKGFKESLCYLEALKRIEYPVVYTRKFFDKIDEDVPRDEHGVPLWVHLNIEIRGLAQEAIKPLEKLAQELENELGRKKPSDGRPSADDKGFVRAIAKIFSEYLGRPSTTRERPFERVVQIALEAVDPIGKDPLDRDVSRAIKEALKTDK